MSTTTVNYEGITLDLTYEYSKSRRGLRERGTGLQLEPDEPEGWELEVVLHKGEDILCLLSQEHQDALIELIKNQEPDYDYSYCEDRYDR